MDTTFAHQLGQTLTGDSNAFSSRMDKVLLLSNQPTSTQDKARRKADKRKRKRDKLASARDFQKLSGPLMY